MLTMIVPPRGNINVGNSSDYTQSPIRGNPPVSETLWQLRTLPDWFVRKVGMDDRTVWRSQIGQTFKGRYVKGFRRGFQLILPEHFTAGETHYFRGHTTASCRSICEQLRQTD